MKKLFFIIMLGFTVNSFAYNVDDVDLYNHSNQHGVIYKAEDKRKYYTHVDFTINKKGSCGKYEIKKIKKAADLLKEKEQPFWDYKNCIVSEYTYNTSNIIDAYNNYRFDLNKRLLSMEEYKVLDNIAGYLPMNIKKGSNYLYYLGMRNNIIEWNEKNTSLSIKLPILFSGLITDFKMKKEKDSSKIVVEEIFLYDR